MLNVPIRRVFRVMWALAAVAILAGLPTLILDFRHSGYSVHYQVRICDPSPDMTCFDRPTFPTWTTSQLESAAIAGCSIVSARQMLCCCGGHKRPPYVVYRPTLDLHRHWCHASIFGCRAGSDLPA